MKIFHFFLIAFLSYGVLDAQDPVFSQFYMSPVQLNAAFAGVAGGSAAALNYRHQWAGLSNGPVYRTYSGAFDTYFRRYNSGLGIVVLADDAGQGLLRTTSANIAYAYQLQASQNLYLKLGAEVGITQARLNWDRLVFYDQLDAILGGTSPGGTPFPTQEIRPDQLSQNYLDIGAGFLAYSKYWYVGGSFKHLNTPNQSFLNNSAQINGGLPMRFTFHGGAEFPLGQGNKRRNAPFISPNLLYVQQGRFAQINLGAYAGAGPVYGGLAARFTPGNPDAAIVTAGVRMGALRVGYSYDITISNLRGSGGTHEIALSYRIEQSGKIDFNDCLQLFR